jgi:hypothetical protein
MKYELGRSRNYARKSKNALLVCEELTGSLNSDDLTIA